MPTAMSFSAIQSAGDAIDVTREYLFSRSWWQRFLLAIMAVFLGPTGVTGPPGPVDINEEMFDVHGEVPSFGELLDAIDWELAVMVGAGLVFLTILYGLVSAFMEFGFVHSLTSDTVAIGVPAREHWSRVLPLFFFRAIVWGAVAGGGLALLGIGLGLLEVPIQLDSAVLAVFLFLGGGVLYLLNRLTTDFVVPIMYHERRGFLSGWRRLLGVMRREWRQYGAYIPVRIILEIALGIAFSLVMLVALLVLGIIVGVPLAVLTILLLGITPGILITGGVLVLLAIGLLAAAMVPFHTYLRYYTLLVLGDTSEPLDLIPAKRTKTRSRRDR